MGTGNGDRFILFIARRHFSKERAYLLLEKYICPPFFGKQVSVKIEPLYSGASVRPDGFNVEYSIGGARPIEMIFKNSPGGR